jgi:predicted peptidase
MEIVDTLRREFPIDEQSIYLAGNSKGGAGVWNLLANRPNFFAALQWSLVEANLPMMVRVRLPPRCGFHGESDEVVPVSSARDRIAARRKAGGYPIYTEYPGADHDGTTKLAFTEPALPSWMFSQRRR